MPRLFTARAALRKPLLFAAVVQLLAGTAQAGFIRWEIAQPSNLAGLGGIQRIEVNAINNAGQAVGVATNIADGSTRAFFHSDGQSIALGNVPGVNERWSPTAISDPQGPRGTVQIAGNVLSDLDQPTPRSFVQSAESLLGRLGAVQMITASGGQHRISGINGSGQWAGNENSSSFSLGHAYVGSRDGSVVALQSIAERPYSVARAINDAGMVVGSIAHRTNNRDFHAALWNGYIGAMQDLGTLGGTASRAHAVNNQGVVVGDSTLVAGREVQQAFIYRNGVMSRIAENLVSNDSVFSTAVSINNRGQTVGRVGGIAFLHTSSGGAVRLDDRGVPGTVTQINDQGQIVALNELFNPTGTLSWAKTNGGNAADASNWNSGLGFAPGRFFDVVIDTRQTQTIVADANFAAKSLRIDGTTLGRATLELSGGAAVNATYGVTVDAYGILQGDGRVVGRAVENYGVVQAMPGRTLVLEGGLDNRGLVTGTGRIEADLINRGVGASVVVGAGQALTLAGTAHTAFAGARIDISNGGDLRFEGSFVNPGDATLNMQAGTLRVGFDVQRMENGGQVLVGAGRSEMEGHVYNNPRGLIHASQGGQLYVWDALRNDGEVRATGRAQVIYTGPVTGPGNFTGQGEGGFHRFEGGLSPGASPAAVRMGDVQLASVLTMEIGGLIAGSQHDQISFTGSVLLESTSFLAIHLINGFKPHAGDQFTLFSFAQAPVGNFEDFYLPSLSDGLNWDVSQLHTMGVLSITSVPEPPVWWLALMGLMGLGGLTRCRTRQH